MDAIAQSLACQFATILKKYQQTGVADVLNYCNAPHYCHWADEHIASHRPLYTLLQRLILDVLPVRMAAPVLFHRSQQISGPRLHPLLS